MTAFSRFVGIILIVHIILQIRKIFSGVIESFGIGYYNICPLFDQSPRNIVSW